MTHGQGSPNAGAPPLLRSLLDGIDVLSRLDGWLGVGCLVTLTGLMLAEVAVRALSNVFPWVPADIPVAWEYSSYLMAASFTFGAAMTLRAVPPSTCPMVSTAGIAGAISRLITV